MKHHGIPAPDGVTLHLSAWGSGADVLVLSGGPGLVNYLAARALAPGSVRAWWPDPRGVGRSGGGPHSMAQAVADLETLRLGVGVEQWAVVGHSWGSDLAVRYALDHPDAVRRVVGVAGRGLQLDRSWSAAYEAGSSSEPDLDIAWDEEVWRVLREEFAEWVHEPALFRRLADCPVPMAFLAAELDIRPDWPLRQLAALVPEGSFAVVPGVPHDLWHTDPAIWRQAVSAALEDRS